MTSTDQDQAYGNTIVTSRLVRHSTSIYELRFRAAQLRVSVNLFVHVFIRRLNAQTRKRVYTGNSFSVHSPWKLLEHFFAKFSYCGVKIISLQRVFLVGNRVSTHKPAVVNDRFICFELLRLALPFQKQSLTPTTSMDQLPRERRTIEMYLSRESTQEKRVSVTVPG